LFLVVLEGKNFGIEFQQAMNRLGFEAGGFGQAPAGKRAPAYPSTTPI
jgi:hypothetical protein